MGIEAISIIKVLSLNTNTTTQVSKRPRIGKRTIPPRTPPSHPPTRSVPYSRPAVLLSFKNPETNERRRNKIGLLKQNAVLRKIKGRTMEKTIIHISIPEKRVKYFFMCSKKEVTIKQPMAIPTISAETIMPIQ
jgi:hypothetical protein